MTSLLTPLGNTCFIIKDHTLEEKKCGVMYKIKCEVCGEVCDEFCIGEATKPGHMGYI